MPYRWSHSVSVCSDGDPNSPHMYCLMCLLDLSIWRFPCIFVLSSFLLLSRRPGRSSCRVSYALHCADPIVVMGSNIFFMYFLYYLKLARSSRGLIRFRTIQASEAPGIWSSSAVLRRSLPKFINSLEVEFIVVKWTS